MTSAFGDCLAGSDRSDHLATKLSCVSNVVRLVRLVRVVAEAFATKPCNADQDSGIWSASRAAAYNSHEHTEAQRI